MGSADGKKVNIEAWVETVRCSRPPTPGRKDCTLSNKEETTEVGQFCPKCHQAKVVPNGVAAPKHYENITINCDANNIRLDDLKRKIQDAIEMYESDQERRNAKMVTTSGTTITLTDETGRSDNRNLLLRARQTRVRAESITGIDCRSAADDNYIDCGIRRMWSAMKASRTLKDGDTLKKGDTLVVLLRTMFIKVTMPNEKIPRTFHVFPNKTIAKLKKQISWDTGISPGEQKLVHFHTLKDAETLKECGVTHGSFVHLFVKAKPAITMDLLRRRRLTNQRLIDRFIRESERCQQS